MFQMLEKIAPARTSVLLIGESGTGKELVARALHQHSPRAGNAFVALNTSAIASELLESELFDAVRNDPEFARTIEEIRRGLYERVRRDSVQYR